MKMVKVSTIREALTDLTRPAENMCDRLEWSNTDLLRAFIVFLDTQSSMKRNVSVKEGDSDPTSEELKEAVELISSQFRDPFEARGVVVSSLQDEVDDAVDLLKNT